MEFEIGWKLALTLGWMAFWLALASVGRGKK